MSGNRPNKWSRDMAVRFLRALGGETSLPPVLHGPLLEGTSCLPLKIGIHRDLQAAYPDHQWPALRKALRRYCGSMIYYAALRDGRPRHDLEGNPVADLSEKHQRFGLRAFEKKQRYFRRMLAQKRSGDAGV